jgi:hypothetical protein
VRLLRAWGANQELLQKLGLLMTLEVTDFEIEGTVAKFGLNLSNM